MFSWLKSRNTSANQYPALYLVHNSSGFCWVDTQTESSTSCDRLALPILQQLESDGLIVYYESIFSASWEDIYNIIEHPEYSQICSLLKIPEPKPITPSLQSVGTLIDENFGVAICGWTDLKGFPHKIDSINGPVCRISGISYIIPKSSWIVVELVNAMWSRLPSERNDDSNRRIWGKIRQAALNAGCQLNDFLYRSVVLTPEKLIIDLNRVDVAGNKVVEIIPSFNDCPAKWLEHFDKGSVIPSRYDISTDEGIVQVILSPEVKSILSHIKSIPARRVTGVRAEAFLINPFAALGENANLVIDEDQFEQARIKANLIFDSFTAHINKDPMGNPIEVGLNIESANSKSSIKIFTNDDELKRFIDISEDKLQRGFQVIAWQGYEFEIMGHTDQELGILKEALEIRRNGFIQINYSQVYDLSAYSLRVDGIGLQEHFYSPYIAKNIEWFPDQIFPVIVWVNEVDEPVAVPLSPELEELIEDKLAEAEERNSNEIILPSFPRPIPVEEAKNILETVKSFRKNPLSKSEIPPGESKTQNNHRKKGETLIIKANIQGIDYEESRKQLLLNNKSKLVLPKSLKKEINLKKHQEEGISWLQHLFKHSPKHCRGCVLADDMGLGKTLQLLSLIAWAFENDATLPPALIVAPVSLLENWQDEIDKFFNKNALTVGVVYGDKLKELRVPQSSIDSQLIEKGLVKFLKPDWIGNAKIILTTYETLRDLEFSFAAENWSIMICDEAQKIKNPNALVTMAAKKQKVQFKIACTGTPVENTLTDLWCLFDFVQPGFLGGLNEFGRNYSKPIEAKTEVEKQRIAELREKIKPQILRRIKKEVATELKNKIIVNDCQSLPISPFQLSIYTQAISLFAKRNEPGNRSPFKNHLELLQYLRVICTDPRHIGTESSTLDSIESYRKKAPKLHWLLDTLITIKNKDEKVIVFCEFKGIQRLLRHYINEKFGFAPDIVNGDTQASANHERSRQKRIRDFQQKQGFNIIILSPIAVGYGVNIQKANHVIHYTRTWNPAKEDQATDRAYRIGQEKDVYVYYPIITSKDFATFDVKLHQLLEKRREISDDMLNGSGELTANDFNMTEIVPNEYKNDVNPKVDLDYLLRISPKYLEGLAAALWVKQKYTHVHCTPDSGDDGVDVVAINGAKGVLIQCKSSTSDSREITWDAVKDVVTGRAFYENNYPDVKFELVCLSNQVFNAKAKEHAELNNVLLVEQNDIVVMLEKYSITVQDIELFLK